MNPVRRALVLAHRWFGLVAAIWLVLIGSTGAVLVFHEELDAALNPAFHRAESQRATHWATATETSPYPTSAPSLDSIARAAVANHPGAYVRYLDLPDHAGGVARAYLSERVDAPGALPQRIEVALDPSTATVQAERVRGSAELSRANLIPFLYTFHDSLHAGSAGSFALGLLALVWILDHAIAFALSFPRWRRWRQSFLVRRGARGHRLWFDVHRATGLWLLPLTLVLAASGLYFHWFTEVRAAITAVAPISPRYDQTAPDLAEPRHAPPMTFARAVALAEAVPGARGVDGLSYDPRKGLYWASVFDARDLDHRGGRWVFVDAFGDRIVADGHRATGTLGDRIAAWQFPLHSGQAFGATGRIAVLLTGLGLCALVPTGIVIWAGKRGARRRSRRSKPERSAPERSAPEAPTSPLSTRRPDHVAATVGVTGERRG